MSLLPEDQKDNILHLLFLDILFGNVLGRPERKNISVCCVQLLIVRGGR